MQEEQWKAVVGYENYYEVSTLGRVRSLDREVPGIGGCVRRLKGRVLKTSVHRGYLRVSITDDGVNQKHSVPRLVWEAFTVTPLPYRIYHKDHNVLNASLANLSATPTGQCGRPRTKSL